MANAAVERLLSSAKFEGSCVIHWQGWLRREALQEDDAVWLRDEAFALWDELRAEFGATHDDIHEAVRLHREELRRMDYGAYLQSPHWRMVRAEALVYGWNACRLCGSGERLNVHHRTYERRGSEALADLTVLCRDCHELFHDHRDLQT